MAVQVNHPTENFPITVVCGEDNRVQKAFDAKDQSREVILFPADFDAVQAEVDALQAL